MDTINPQQPHLWAHLSLSSLPSPSSPPPRTNETELSPSPRTNGIEPTDGHRESERHNEEVHRAEVGDTATVGGGEKVS